MHCPYCNKELTEINTYSKKKDEVRVEMFCYPCGIKWAATLIKENLQQKGKIK